MDATLAFCAHVAASWQGSRGCEIRSWPEVTSEGGAPCDDPWRRRQPSDRTIVATAGTTRRVWRSPKSVGGYRSGALSVGVGGMWQPAQSRVRGPARRLFTSSDIAPQPCPVCHPSWSQWIQPSLSTTTEGVQGAMQRVTEIRYFSSDARRGRRRASDIRHKIMLHRRDYWRPLLTRRIAEPKRIDRKPVKRVSHHYRT